MLHSAERYVCEGRTTPPFVYYLADARRLAGWHIGQTKPCNCVLDNAHLPPLSPVLPESSADSFE